MPRRTTTQKLLIRDVVRTVLKALESIRKLVSQYDKYKLENNAGLQRAFIMRFIDLGESLTFFREQNSLLDEIQCKIDKDDTLPILYARNRNSFVHKYPYRNDQDRMTLFNEVYEFFISTFSQLEEGLQKINAKKLGHDATCQKCITQGKIADNYLTFEAAKNALEFANHETTLFFKFLESENVILANFGFSKADRNNAIKQLLEKNDWHSDACKHYLLTIYQLLIDANNVLKKIASQVYYEGDLAEFYNTLSPDTRAFFDSIAKTRADLVHQRTSDYSFDAATLDYLREIQQHYVILVLEKYEQIFPNSSSATTTTSSSSAAAPPPATFSDPSYQMVLPITLSVLNRLRPPGQEEVALSLSEGDAEAQKISQRKRLRLTEQTEQEPSVPEKSMVKRNKLEDPRDTGKNQCSISSSEILPAVSNLTTSLIYASAISQPILGQKIANSEKFSSEEIELAKEHPVKDLPPNEFANRTVKESVTPEKLARGMQKSEQNLTKKDKKQAPIESEEISGVSNAPQSNDDLDLSTGKEDRNQFGQKKN